MRAANGPLQTLRRTVTGRPLLADLAGQLEAMEVPTLILTGDEDHVCIDTSLYLKRLLPAAGLSIGSRDRSCRQPGGGRALQPDPRLVLRRGRDRSLVSDPRCVPVSILNGNSFR